MLPDIVDDGVVLNATPLHVVKSIGAIVGFGFTMILYGEGVPGQAAPPVVAGFAI